MKARMGRLVAVLFVVFFVIVAIVAKRMGGN